MKKLKIKKEKLKIGLGIFVFVTFLIINPLYCQAFFLDEIFNSLEELISDISNSTGTVQVINEINVSAKTGDNVIDGEGEIKEGETKSQVFVKNIINGKEIGPIDIETEANEVSATSEVKVDDGLAQVHQEITIDSEKKVEDYEVNLEDSEVKPENGGVLDTVQNWWLEFVQALESFIQNIFNIF